MAADREIVDFDKHNLAVLLLFPFLLLQLFLEKISWKCWYLAAHILHSHLPMVAPIH